ncbi:MAG: YgjV family protein, partial [Bdellovibrionales bacterium]
HLLLAISAGLGFYAFQTSGRKRMLTCKFCADGLYGIYLFFLGGMTGAAGAMIAMLGGLTQILTPAHLTRKSLPYRFVVACILSVSGAYYLSESLTDVMPLIGVVVARFVELFQSTLILRCGFFFATGTWVYYTYMSGFYLATCMSLLMMTAVVLGILKNERKLPKDPLP